MFEDNETTLPELKARVEKTIDFLKTIKPEQIDGTEDKKLIVKVGGKDTEFGGMQFLLGRSLPTSTSTSRPPTTFFATTAWRSASATFSDPRNNSRDS